jgi:hypothetical protein
MMVEKKSWEEFRSHGLLLFINQFLHIFGWAIVFDTEGDKVVGVYPARVKFRGFDNEDTSEAYEKITKYMVNNSTELDKDIQDE